MFVWLSVIDKKVAHPNEIQNTFVFIYSTIHRTKVPSKEKVPSTKVKVIIRMKVYNTGIITFVKVIFTSFIHRNNLASWRYLRSTVRHLSLIKRENAAVICLD